MRQFRILHYMLLCLTLLCLGACGDEYMKDYDPAEEERKEDTEEIVKSKVSVEVEKEDVVWYYTFKTSLHKEFPYSDIQYGARIRSYDKGHWHEIYVTEEGEGNICEMHVYAVKFHSEKDYKKACAEYDLFKQQYDAWKVIIDNGTASESEKDLYNSLKEILKDLKDINFQAEPIVCIDGEIYELE